MDEQNLAKQQGDFYYEDAQKAFKKYLAEMERVGFPCVVLMGIPGRCETQVGTTAKGKRTFNSDGTITPAAQVFYEQYKIYFKDELFM